MAASDRKLELVITARDGSKQVFALVAAAAGQMGASVQKSGAVAARSLDDLGSHAKSASATLQSSGQTISSIMDSVGKHAALLGTAIGATLVLGLKNFQTASTEVGAAQALLRTAVENTGASFSTYQGALQAVEDKGVSLGFSVKDTAESLQVLTQETNNTATAMGLMGLVEDLARARHLTLEQSTLLVTQALTGNISALKQHGIILENNATQQEILAALQAKVAGQASTYAKTNAGELEMLHAKWEQISAGVGNHLGELNLVVGMLPGLKIAYGAVAGAGGLVVDMMRAQKLAAAEATVAIEAETVAARAAGAASIGGRAVGEAGLIGSLAGPAGIIAAVAAAGAGIYLLTRHTDEYRTAADAAATDTEKLAAAIATLQAGGGSPQATASLTAIKDQWVALDVASAKYNESLRILATMPGTIDLSKPATPDEAGWAAAARAAKAYVDQVDAAHAALQAIPKAQEDAITSDIESIFKHPGVDPQKAQAAISALFDEFKAGTIDAQGLQSALDDLNTSGWTTLTNQVATADAATNSLVTKLHDMTKAAHDAWDSVAGPGAALASSKVGDELKAIDTSFDSAAQSIQDKAAAFGVAYEAALNEAQGDPTKIKAATEMYVAAIDALYRQLITSETDHATAAEMASQAMADINAQMDLQAIAAGGATEANTKLAASLYELAHARNGAQPDNGQLGYYAPLPHTPLDNRAPSQFLPTPALDLHGTLDQAAVGYDATRNAVDRLGSGLRDASTDWAAFAKAAQAAFDANVKTAAGYAQATGGVKDFLQAIAAMPDASYATKIASGAADAAAQLSNMTRVVISNTQAIANDSDSLLKWADDLIGAQGEYSKLDELVAKHKITGTSGVYDDGSEYAKAQDAYNRIAKDNVKVQEAMLVIQAKQAPLLADLADKQAKYLEKVEGMKPAEQLAAIGMMDANEQMKAQSVIALAAAAAQGKIGEEGQKAARKVIEGAVAADPVLGAMLQNMGLIRVGADGTITLNMDGFETTQIAIDHMTDAVNVLIDLLSKPIVITTQAEVDAARMAVDRLADHINDIPASWTTTTNADTAQAGVDLDNLKSQIENLPDHTATVTANVYGLGDIDTLRNSIDGLYDRYVSVGVTTYYNTVGSPSAPGYGYSSGNQLGGVIQRHAGGGVASWLAEAGPELLDFPGGGRGMAYDKGVYRVPEGTYVNTAPATKLMNKGSGQVIQNYFSPIYIQPASGSMQAELNRSAVNRYRRG